MTQRPQDQQPCVVADKAHPADQNVPQPGHESGSSGTSDYGRSDYDEPGDHERAERDEAEAKQTQSQKSARLARPVR